MSLLLETPIFLILMISLFMPKYISFSHPFPESPFWVIQKFKEMEEPFYLLFFVVVTWQDSLKQEIQWLCQGRYTLHRSKFQLTQNMSSINNIWSHNFPFEGTFCTQRCILSLQVCLKLNY